MQEKNKLELSEEAHRLLVELCVPYRSSPIALEKPEFVLVELLKTLNKYKHDVSSCTMDALDWGISKGHLERLLREVAKQEQLQPA